MFTIVNVKSLHFRKDNFIFTFQSVLSSIIVVSLFGIFLQFRDLRRYAKRSYSEAFVWMSTFLSTVFLDVDLGLLIGLVVSLLFLIAWGYFPKIELIGQTEYKDLFLQADSFQKVENSLQFFEIFAK